MARWDEAFEKIQPAKTPTKVLGELSRATTLLRDLENKNFTFDSIVVNDESYVNQIREYMRINFPDREKVVRLFKGRLPIFEHYGINRQIRTLFGRNVPMSSGAYLIIEHTEALHVIDVNSGNSVRSATTQEESALAVNLEAADEIARQLRLRDMGGIIVVDFIDLYKAENRKILFQRMRDAMKDDKAKHNILPPSKIGLIQITRERVRPQINIETAEACPSCQGSGKVTASVNLTDEIAIAFSRKIEKHPKEALTLLVHPYVEAYLNKGLFTSVWKKWKKAYGRQHRLEPRTTLGMLEYRFTDAQGTEK
jgi:ribonuclease G